jgi:hypothetical protein
MCLCKSGSGYVCVHVQANGEVSGVKNTYSVPYASPLLLGYRTIPILVHNQCMVHSAVCLKEIVEKIQMAVIVGKYP